MDGPLPDTLTQDWLQLLGPNGEHRTNGRLTCPEVFDHPVLFPLQRQREMRQMILESRKYSPKVVCEVGADKGGSLLHWCCCLTDPVPHKVIACEVRGTPYSGVFESAFPEIDFLWLPASSREVDSLLKVRDFLLGERIDVLFLDGDKSFFLQDFDAWVGFMSPNGIVFMHDVSDPAPKDAFHALKRRGWRTEEIIDRQESCEAMSRSEQGIPSASQHENWLRTWRGTSCTVGMIFMDGRTPPFQQRS